MEIIQKIESLGVNFKLYVSYKSTNKKKKTEKMVNRLQKNN